MKSIKSNIINEIASIVGKENCSTSIADLYAYGFDASIHHANPDVVVRPGTTEEVQKIVRLANREMIPIVPRGAGTALCGHAVPVAGGILLDMTRMSKVLEIRVEDLYCVVEPGIVYDKLNSELQKRGFWFPPTPGSGEMCTVGGMVATNASGMKAIKYGATRDYVMGLEVVMPNGDIAQLGTRTLKDASGYQLARLMVGSEGTLGVITKIILRISPMPQKKAAVLASFEKIRDAGQCVSNIIAKPIIPAAIEFMDKVCIQAVNKAVNAGFPDCEAVLIIESDGHPNVVKEEIEKIKEVCKSSGAIKVEMTEDIATMNKWTASRKAVLPALSRLGEKYVSVSLADDMGVPISKIPDAVVAFQEIAKKNNVIVGTYGHAGDGNLHTKMLVDPVSKESWQNGENATREIFDVCISLGGTVTGEHGVAITKAPYMMKERASSISIMKSIKRALDPNNIMNPYKNVFWEKGILHNLRYPVENMDKEMNKENKDKDKDKNKNQDKNQDKNLDKIEGVN